MNGGEVKYLRQVTAYNSSLVLAVVIFTAGYLAPETWVTVGLYAVGFLSISRSRAYYTNSYNRRLWSLFTSFEYRPIDERKQIYESGEEL